MEKKTRDVTVKVRATATEHRTWARRAALDGRSISGWVRQACAEKVLRESPQLDQDEIASPGDARQGGGR